MTGEGAHGRGGPEFGSGTRARAKRECRWKCKVTRVPFRICLPFCELGGSEGAVELSFINCRSAGLQQAWQDGTWGSWSNPDAGPERDARAVSMLVLCIAGMVDGWMDAGG